MRSNRKKYTAGQWVFVCIPRLGCLHWHPFTISSSGFDKYMTCHFPCAGKWTTEVGALALKGEPVKVCMHMHYPSRLLAAVS